jgi:putative endonuclease
VSGRALGRMGEELADAYLQAQGYRVLARNFRSRRGEVDIVAQKGERLVFVEVKRWNAYAAGELEYALDRRKQRRILDAARHFLLENPGLQGSRIACDVILLSGREPEIRHIEDAFDGV